MPFGEDLPVVGQTEVLDEEAGGYKYTGQKEVVSIGLYYYGARYYDPEIARFITEDSYSGEIGNPQSQNLYVYVMNNPLRYVDPSGMYSELPDPQEIYQEWSNIWIARSNNAILQERELKQILKQRLDPIVFDDKFSMFNQGITDALGPEFQEINKEKQFSGTMVGVSND